MNTTAPRPGLKAGPFPKEDVEYVLAAGEGQTLFPQAFIIRHPRKAFKTNDILHRN